MDTDTVKQQAVAPSHNRTYVRHFAETTIITVSVERKTSGEVKTAHKWHINEIKFCQKVFFCIHDLGRKLNTINEKCRNCIRY
jgi:hypothetical protein